MKASELRQLSIDELRSKSAELRGELFGARMKHETGQLENRRCSGHFAETSPGSRQYSVSKREAPE